MKYILLLSLLMVGCRPARMAEKGPPIYERIGEIPSSNCFSYPTTLYRVRVDGITLYIVDDCHGTSITR